MHAFKKILLSCLLFLGLAVAGTLPFVILYVNGDYGSDEDLGLRNSLAGRIDFLITGASTPQHALIPEEIDRAAGCFSYNLSGSLQDTKATRLLLEHEIARNPVRLVAIGVSQDTFSRSQVLDGAEGILHAVPRLSGFRERMGYVCTELQPHDWEIVYRNLFVNGTAETAAFLHGENIHRVSASDRGFEPGDAMDLTKTPAGQNPVRDSVRIKNDFQAENDADVLAMIRECRDAGCRVVLVGMPVSGSDLYCETGWEKYHAHAEKIAAEGGAAFLDFNLLRDRYTLLNDAESFKDPYHLSTEGAKQFSPVFADIVFQWAGGEDVSGYFYSSYEEAKNDSPCRKQVEAAGDAAD